MTKPSMMGPGNTAPLSTCIMTCKFMCVRERQAPRQHLIQASELSEEESRPRKRKGVLRCHLTALGHISGKRSFSSGIYFFPRLYERITSEKKGDIQLHYSLFMPKQNTCQKELHFTDALRLMLLIDVSHLLSAKY